MLTKTKLASLLNKTSHKSIAVNRKVFSTQHVVLSAFLLLALYFLPFNKTFAQLKELRSIYNGSFKPGEKFKLRVHYGFIDAGYVTMEIMPEPKDFGSRTCWHIVGMGTSAGKIDFFFKIRDRYESYIDADAVVPWFHIRSVKEGSFTFYETDNFNHYNNTVVNEHGTYQFPDQVQDIISSFYYTRCVYTDNMKEGEIIPVKAFFDDENTNFNVKYLGRETLKTDIGEVKCLKFRPQIQKGRVFKDQEGMTVYVSDDKNYIPIRIEAKLLVGSIKADIMEYSGLANPFTALSK